MVESFMEQTIAFTFHLPFSSWRWEEKINFHLAQLRTVCCDVIVFLLSSRENSLLYFRSSWKSIRILCRFYRPNDPGGVTWSINIFCTLLCEEQINANSIEHDQLFIWVDMWARESNEKAISNLIHPEHYSPLNHVNQHFFRGRTT